MYLKKIFFALFLLAFFGFSCHKPKCDENVPAIGYKTFIQYRDAQDNMVDTAKIIITFKDCDGDIGLEERDTVKPYDYNFYLKYFEMVKGSWVMICDTCFKYRIPKLTPEGQSKILEGEIGITISPFYFDFMSPDSDTIKYSVVLYDKELHESNEVETPMIFTK